MFFKANCTKCNESSEDVSTRSAEAALSCPRRSAAGMQRFPGLRRGGAGQAASGGEICSQHLSGAGDTGSVTRNNDGPAAGARECSEPLCFRLLINQSELLHISPSTNFLRSLKTSFKVPGCGYFPPAASPVVVLPLGWEIPGGFPCAPRVLWADNGTSQKPGLTSISWGGNSSRTAGPREILLFY